MRRLLAPLAVLIAVALSLSACDADAGPYAAKVNGQTISTGTLNDALQSVAGDGGLRCFLAVGSENATTQAVNLTVEGTGLGTYSSSFAASQLTELILERELSSVVGHLGLSKTREVAQLATDRLIDDLTPGSGSPCTTSGASTLGALSTTYRNTLISEEADQDLLGAHFAGVQLSTSGLAAYAAKNPQRASLACVSAILTPTLADANAARQAITQGASFATVAKAKSTDSSSAPNGGVIGCLAPDEFQAPLSTDLESLPTGVLSKPLSFSGQYVVFLITKREAPTAAQTLNAVLAAESSAEATYLNRIYGSDSVSVDPRYGTWKHLSGSWEVVPPNGPANDVLENTGAISPKPISLG